MKILQLISIGLIISLSEARHRSDPEIDRAVKKASEYILSKRDPQTLEWKPRETAAAILGLSSADPLWRINENHTPLTQLEVTQSITALKLAFSEVISSLNGKIKKMDDSTLTQFITAFQASCVDPKNVLGYNLIEESQNRLKNTFQRSPSIAVLSLPLCIEGVSMPLDIIKKLTIPKRRGTTICQSLCIEKASLNIITLSCMFGKSEYESMRKEIFNLIRENAEYIKVKNERKKTQSLFDTSLLLQTHDVSPVRVPVLSKPLFDDILSFQEPDGSFGGSVALTAIAIPALSHFNAIDIQSVKCPAKVESKGNNWGIFNYEIYDEYLNTQFLSGEFNTTLVNGKDLDVLTLINRFQEEFPAVFRFDLRKTPLGSTIDSLIGIPSNRLAIWNVYIRVNGEQKQIYDLETQVLPSGGTVIFVYENV